MPAIVEHPTVVQEAVKRFGHLFPNEPERRHFGDEVTGGRCRGLGLRFRAALAEK